MKRTVLVVVALITMALPSFAAAEAVLFSDVRIFDGTGSAAYAGNVLVRDGLIEKVSRAAIDVPGGATVIDGEGRLLTPGFIDLHSHLAGHVADGLDSRDPVVQGAFAAKVASYYLDHGFTTVRDAGGTSPGLARAFRSGEIEGPRLFASGAVISQTAGHGDFRERHEPHPFLQSGSPYLGGRSAVLADGVDRTLADQDHGGRRRDVGMLPDPHAAAVTGRDTRCRAGRG